MSVELQNLTIVHYPDPRLRKVCDPVTEFDGDLTALVKRMRDLMHEGRGVGLAAPQVGVNKRLFVMNITGEEKDDLVFINPEIHDMHGVREAEEGCLSLPDVHVQIRRATECTIKARDLDGEPFELRGEDLLCRVWQHETDHLSGTLILDRMGPSDKIATKKKLKELEASYREKRRR
ncbi:MAG: peptide deformylase [Planctomycetes bacterium]|nr:peptide deformylase [Planctomycetota bacterium]